MYVAGRVRVTINPVYVRGGQSARDDINDVIYTHTHTQLLYIIGRSVIIVIIITIIIIVIIIIIESEVTEKFFYFLRILATAPCCLSVERPKSDGLFFLELRFQGRRL